MVDTSLKNYGLSSHNMRILEEYRENQEVFEKMRSIVREILEKSMERNHVYVNAIEARVKSEESLAGKLERKGEKYQTLRDVTDILGTRIITFYSDEVDKIAALIARIFEVDWEKSIDKRKMHELHSFGYSSLHYICRIPRTLYCDEKCLEMNEFYFEIQMRTALQHVWSVLDHDTGYKSGFEVPHEYLRNLNRLAGMLELVDEQFCQIRTGINDYRRTVQTLVSSGRFEDVSLNGDSFQNYLQLRPFDSINKKIASINQAEIHESSLLPYLKVFRLLKYRTLADVENLIKENSDDAFRLAASQLAGTELDIINSSLGVMSLVVVQILKHGGGVAVLKAVYDELYGESENNRTRAERLYEKAKQLSFV